MSRTGLTALAALFLVGCHDGPLGGNRQLEPPPTEPAIRVVKRTPCISEGPDAMTVCEVVVTTVNNEVGAEVHAQCFVAAGDGWALLDVVNGAFTQPLRCLEGGMDYDEDVGGTGTQLRRARPVHLTGGLQLVSEPYATSSVSVGRAVAALDSPARNSGPPTLLRTKPALLVALPGGSSSSSEELFWQQLVTEPPWEAMSPETLPAISAANPSAALFVQPALSLFYVSRQQQLIVARFSNGVWRWVDSGVANVAQVEGVKVGTQIALAWAHVDGTVELGIDDGASVQRLATLGQSSGPFAFSATDAGVAFVLRHEDGTLWLHTADLTGKVSEGERIPTDGATQPGLVVRAGVPTVSFVEETADGPVTVVAEKKSGGWVRTVLQ